LRLRLLIGLLAHLPLAVLYAVFGVVRIFAFDLVGYRRDVIDGNLAASLVELDDRERDRIGREFRIHVGHVLAEIIHGGQICPESLRRRVALTGFDAVLRHLGRGMPVIVAAAHQCNWEWLLLRMSLESPYPVEAAYKPLHDEWAERWMSRVRSRFRARLMPAKTLLPDVLKAGPRPRIIALVADQEPVSAERRHWTQFLGRETAFYCGLGDLARVTRYPVFFARMWRRSRGNYTIGFEPIVESGETLGTAEITERYVRKVEAQIREAPPDWLWANRRWKLKRGLYT